MRERELAEYGAGEEGTLVSAQLLLRGRRSGSADLITPKRRRRRWLS
jgi:hypothetical protein